MNRVSILTIGSHPIPLTKTTAAQQHENTVSLFSRNRAQDAKIILSSNHDAATTRSPW